MASFSKKQISPIMAKYGVDENSSTFQRIISMFDNQTNYQIWALKGVYSGNFTLTELSNFKNFSDNNPDMLHQLSKQTLTAYTTKDDIAKLKREIEGGNIIMAIKRSVERLNTAQRNIIRAELFPPSGRYDELPLLTVATSKQLKDAAEIFKKFETFSSAKLDNLIHRTSSMRDYKTIMEFIEGSLLSTYKWSKESMLGFIASHKETEGVEVVIDKGSYLLLQIPTYAASKALGGNSLTSWCITSCESHWKSYVVIPNRKQYFLFDFSKPAQGRLSGVAFTMDGAKITNAHERQDDDIMYERTIGNEKISIHKLLEMANIPMSTFVKLKGLGYFNWNIDEIVNFVNKNSNNLQIIANDDKRLLVKIKSADAFDKICHNSLVNGHNMNYQNDEIFTLLDLNLPSDNEKSMLVLDYCKDVYGSLKLSNIKDAFGTSINDYVKKLPMNLDEWVGANIIDPSILVHKFIDENNEHDLINLLKSDVENKIDANKVFKEELPFEKMINRKMYKGAKLLMNKPSFNINEKSATFESSILTSLCLQYISDKVTDGVTNNSDFFEMICSVIENPKTDVNMQDLLGDNPLLDCAENPDLNEIFDVLVKRTDIDVNVRNEDGESALTKAIKSNNTHVIDFLLSRSDLEINDLDKEEAAKAKIDLTQHVSTNSKFQQAFANIFH